MTAAEQNPRRYLALWLPTLATDRLRRMPAPGSGGAPAEAPLATVGKVKGALRLASVNGRAAALGLSAGMALADARARIPDLAVAPADPGAERRLLEAVAAACERFTPLVAITGDDGATLDITGCAHLFGGEMELARVLARRMARMGLAVRISIAGTPQAAEAFVRYSAETVVPPQEGEARARALPVRALDAPAESIVALSRAGLKTIGALLDRPSVLLTARFGERMSASLRRIAGREDIRITPLRPPPECMVERAFAEPLTHAEAIGDMLRTLAAGLMGALEARGMGGRRFEASFYRVDGIVRRIAVETLRPTRDARLLLSLLNERLEALSDPLNPGFGFDAIRLATPVLDRIAHEQGALDGGAAEADPAALDHLIDRLTARFGREQVLCFVEVDSHAPRRAARLAPAGGLGPMPAGGLGRAAAQTAWAAPEPDEPPLRPLQMFEPPQPIEALAEVPDGPPLRFRWRRVLHDVALAEGPERIAPEWWRAGPEAETRDYYRIEDGAGRRFWVFRQGFYTGEQGLRPRWYMHGLFA